MVKKKKGKRRPRKPKRNLSAMRSRPKPITLRGPHYFINHAREYPLVGSWIMAGWQEKGLTPVVVARQHPHDRVVFATYLVDYYCLGVKDAFWKSDYSLKRFNKELPQLCSGEPEVCDIALAHVLVYGAIDFARRYGFEPHPDFKLASMVLDPPGTYPSRGGLEFGRDGKPFFIAGPYDNAKAILTKLEQTAGQGNYDYLVALGDLESFAGHS